MDTKKLIADALNPRPRVRLLRFLTVVSLPVALFLCAGLCFYGPINSFGETKVVDGFMAKTTTLTPHIYAASITGKKISDCQLVPNSQVGWAFDGVWREVKFAFVDDTSPNSSRPVGMQSFGIWRWEKQPTDSMVRLSIQHICNERPVLSLIGPFKF